MEQQKFKLVAEKGASVFTILSGSIGDMESEVRAGSKATVDRWVNLINRILASKPIS